MNRQFVKVRDAADERALWSPSRSLEYSSKSRELSREINRVAGKGGKRAERIIDRFLFFTHLGRDAPARGAQILSAEYGVPGGFTATPRPPLIPIMREKQRGPL